MMTVTTLNISPQAIKALVTRGNEATRHGVVLPPGTLRNGLILQPEIVAEQLKSLFSSGTLPRDRIICSINGLPFSYRILTIPKMEPSAFNEAVLRAVKKEMPISPDEMYLSWQAYPAENNEWQVIVTGITRHPVDNLIKTLTGAGIRPWLLDLPHLALARLARQADAIIVDFEKDCSNIVMLVEGVPRGMHMVPALGQGASLEDQVGQVTDKLAKMIDFYNGSHPAKPIPETVKVLVTGELLNDERTIEFIRPQVTYPVELLTTANKALSGLPLHELAVNAGSELLDVQPGKDTKKDAVPHQNLNLEKIIKERRPKTDIGKSIKRILVPLALVVGISVLVVSYLSQREAQASISELEADMTRVNAEFSQQQESASQSRLLEDSIDETEAMIEDIKDDKHEIFESKNYVSDISSIIENMPEGLTFSTMEIDTTQITVQGSTYQASSVVQFARNLETSGDFSQAIIIWIDRSHSSNEDNPGLAFQIVIYK